MHAQKVRLLIHLSSRRRSINPLEIIETYVVRARELMKPITLYGDAPLKMVFSPTYCRCYPIHTILHSTHKLFYRFPYDLFLDMFVSRSVSQKERSPIDKTFVNVL